MKIGYVTFWSDNDAALSYGLALMLYKNNIAAEVATEKTAKYYDVLLFSINWFLHVVQFYAFCEGARVGKKYGARPLVVVGGFNTFNPTVYNRYAHIVCVGDGENVVGDILAGNQNPHCYYDSTSRPTWNNADISDQSYVYYDTRNTARIEVARGCPYRCAFCQISALKKYREVRADCLINSISKAQSKSTVLFAPERTVHSEYNKICKAMTALGVKDSSPDVRFNNVEKHTGSNMIQVGIEGITEGLRFSVGKRCTDDRLREIVRYAIGRSLASGNKPCLVFGIILDLPGETADSYKEFSDTLDSFESIENIDKLNLFFVFNMFQPLPFTKLECASINCSMNAGAAIKTFLGKDRKYKVAVRGRPHGIESRLLSLAVTRGGETAPDIVARLLAVKKIKSKYPLVKRYDHTLRDRGGLDALCGAPKEKPWQIVSVNNAV